MEDTKIVSGVIDRLEGKQAVIKLENNQEVFWPALLLPETLTEGSAVQITLTAAASVTEGREALAKDLLNEVLNVSEDEQKN